MDEARDYIKKWKNHLNIKKYRIYLEEIKDRQIKCYIKDCDLVGVVTNDHGENTATKRLAQKLYTCFILKFLAE